MRDFKQTIHNTHSKLNRLIADKVAIIAMFARLPAGMITASGFLIKDKMTRPKIIVKQNRLKN